MDREYAYKRLCDLKDQDLVKLAKKYNVSIFVNGKKNKGWAGRVIEEVLDIPANSSREPNGGSWELKLASLVRKPDGKLKVKETMQICMINAEEVADTQFSESHLYRKFHRMIIVAREWHGPDEPSSEVRKVVQFDLNMQIESLLQDIERDYNEVRESIRQWGNIDRLTGRMGTYVQPRTKGQGGDAPRTRAFYARTRLISKILGLD